MLLVLSCERKRIKPIRTMCFDWWKFMCSTRGREWEWERESARLKPNNEHWWFSRRSSIYDVRYKWVMLLPKNGCKASQSRLNARVYFIRYGYAIWWLDWLVHVFVFDSKIVSYFLLIIFPFIARCGGICFCLFILFYTFARVDWQ